MSSDHNMQKCLLYLQPKIFMSSYFVVSLYKLKFKKMFACIIMLFKSLHALYYCTYIYFAVWGVLLLLNICYRMTVIPAKGQEDHCYAAYVTEDKVGLSILPMDGNPHNAMALIAHPSGVYILKISYLNNKKVWFIIVSFMLFADLSSKNHDAYFANSECKQIYRKLCLLFN